MFYATWAILPAMVMAFGAGGGGRRRHMRGVGLALAFLFLLGLTMTACGGGTATSTAGIISPNGNQGTKPATYTVTINGTSESGTLNRSTTVSLVVQ